MYTVQVCNVQLCISIYCTEYRTKIYRIYELITLFCEDREIIFTAERSLRFFHSFPDKGKEMMFAVNPN